MSSLLSSYAYADTPMDRLFFAVVPDAEATARIGETAARIRTARGLSGKALAPERLHVSLHHLGDYDTLPQSILANAFVAGASLAVAPFEVAFDRAGSFKRGERSCPLVLRSSDEAGALAGLHRALGLEMKRTGLGNWVRADFTPHVTVLYDDQLVEEVPIAPVRWTVRDVVLVHSLLGQTQHVRLARWSLRG